MKKRIKYTDEPMEFRIIPDFLPPPEQLVKRMRKMKVTLELPVPTVDSFSRRAGKRAYQKLMTELLDVYARKLDGRK